MTPQEQLKQAKKSIKKAQQQIQEAEDLINAYKEPKRWRAEYGERYYHMCGDGRVTLDTESGCHIDNKYCNCGNHFATEQHAKDSFIHFAINGKYEYWIPHSGMHKPEDVPDGCEYHCDGGWTLSTGGWLSESEGVDNWSYFVRRWPKSSYRGE